MQTPYARFQGASDRIVNSVIDSEIADPLGYTAVSTKVVPQKRYSVRDNAEWSYG